MKIAIAIDWLDKYAGSERVITSMSKVFCFKEAYALTSIMSRDDLEKTFNGSPPNLFITNLRFLGKNFRVLFPLFSFCMNRLKVSEDINILISSSHATAKAINTSKHTFHVCYFQARNMKYIWEEKDLYLSGLKRIYCPLLPWLRKIDILDSCKPDLIIANSLFVQDWIYKTYQRDSLLVYPPVNVSNFRLGDHKEDFFVTVGRLEPYKRFDLIIDAFILNGLKLIVIGDGSQKIALEKKASSNIEFVGYLESDQINTYLGRARAFVYAGVEDFGIAPVEAQATGCPVICLDKAGTAETVISGKTGVLFKEQSIESINLGIKTFIDTEHTFDFNSIRKHSKIFSEERFCIELKSIVSKKYIEFKGEKA